ncbi:small ribosomal subunit Rsm22 family protein [Phenylobacterium sp.]|jgi:ribosomal protein RSM22 (predicted rRNA methylase)|uniref:small ribosomal subunit Rsm22 family protein n=1 Tax=Phenylobacterium sp. TaxID=1871053 RepID=UPI002E37D961|nr:small ribosomal subunit Rsm22 family protein [Phenylobacterium sp.]HEX3364057.1 small ribosomal subunit Rsm22 family protein [Phenylobacterium sp.]
MTPDLPAALRGALGRALESVPRKGLAERAARTSEAYRAGKPSSGVIREADDALAYALTRLPATYAACATVLAEAARAAPGFAPASLLDAGAGTGAASWAASETWPRLASLTWLDSSPPFLVLAAQLAAEGPPALRTAEARRADLTSAGPWPKAEVVVASYALAEIASDRQDSTVSELWNACEGVLALIEPGTPAGYARILAARTALIEAGATILAPCSHEAACPLVAPDWCHFSVRLPRSRDHRQAKGAEVPFEDERFSYLIAARPGIAAESRRPRILAPPRTAKPGIALKLCGPDGEVEQRVVPKRDKAAYAVARRLDWGDTV